ncbi:TauD/TfdA dioxygenase family protein [Paraburkholderia gardini]|uniref:TauD/TfdA dioxygenase family protein n=1 Tax=Paraburkholderia gardini TaxID=2823469 RepID=UPI001D51F525|nr:TauD/TfdA family dioxygenase [Paraburkholderia gardini]CAG4899940.1 Pentalenolactone F synthase [Paraburkholderia gardini]
MKTLDRLDGTPLKDGVAFEVGVRVNEFLTGARPIEELEALWRSHPVLVFRREALLEEELVAFSSLLGECEAVSRKDILSPYSDKVIYFSTLRYADGRNLGGFAGGEDVDWHSDQTFRPAPSTGAILYGVEVPRDGGDIYWADQYRAWSLLPEDVRSKIDGKMGTYRYAKRLAIMNATELKGKFDELSRTPDVRHPVVLEHPLTGRKALYADPTTLVSIDGLSEEENARILRLLFEAGGDESAVYRHKVLSGDLMMWDNGCTMHRRDVMTLEQPRLMKRTTFRLPAAKYCVPY